MELKLTNIFIAFGDIRGFTYFSDANYEKYLKALKAVNGLWKIVKYYFPNSLRKPEGDGIVIMAIFPEYKTKEESALKVYEFFTRIKRIHDDFTNLLRDDNLKMGFGLTVGYVTPAESGDQFGRDLAKAKRLCDLARPYGLVIDYEDFNVLDGVIDFKVNDVKLFGFIDAVKVFSSSEVVL